MNKNELDFLMGVAELSASRSKAIRAQVGGVVTDAKGNFVAAAYNGTVHGADNTCEIKIYESVENDVNQQYPYTELYEDGSFLHYRLVTNEAVTIHAEQNLISHAARRGISIDGGTAILTLSPCAKCTSLMIQSGIKEVIYRDQYRLHHEVEKLYGNYIKLTHYQE